MKSDPDFIGKFVRLDLTNEVVELERYDSNSRNVTVKYRGKSLTLRFDEISVLTPGEISLHEQFLKQSGSAA